MIDPTIQVQGVSVPRMLYGTAWKEERTAGLVAEALRAGFRGVDTANQRRHYDEAAVGEALEAFERRSEVFLQTKFTFLDGQDARLPYDRHASVSDQVRQSVASSLEHLGVERIDSLLLHGPQYRSGLGREDLEAWRTIEEAHSAGATRLVGISNFSAEQLVDLCQVARVRPAFVQNRCFARRGWDRAVREVCRQEGVVYQGFSLLTANPATLDSQVVRDVAQRLGRTPEQVVFRFALQLGMVCLTGTADPNHMRQDLQVFDFAISEADMGAIERCELD